MSRSVMNSDTTRHFPLTNIFEKVINQNRRGMTNRPLSFRVMLFIFAAHHQHILGGNLLKMSRDPLYLILGADFSHDGIDIPLRRNGREHGELNTPTISQRRQSRD